MRKKSIWFIVNPISGTKNKEAIVSMIPEYMDPERFEYRILFTEYRNHAAELAREACENDIDVCVAVGGDGTVNEIARALIHTETALGIIPCGSGNGLARHLRLPLSPRGALQVIADCCIHSLDYGLINGQPFFCTAGVGFDALLSDRFNRSGRRGLISYIQNALTTGINYKSEDYELIIDGVHREVYHAFLITCANASQYGNDFYIAPHASMSDGLMDVTIMEPFFIIEAPAIAIQLVNKTITSNPRIKHFRCRDLIIRRKSDGVIHYDGDPKEEKAEVHIQIVPHDIRMIVFNDRSSQLNPHRIGRLSADMLKHLRGK